MNKIESIVFRKALELTQNQNREIKLLKKENRRLKEEILNLKNE